MEDTKETDKICGVVVKSKYKKVKYLNFNSFLFNFYLNNFNLFFLLQSTNEGKINAFLLDIIYTK